MKKLEQIEQAVARLSAEELGQFRKWFAEFDAAAWDQQFEVDAQAGKLNALAERALHDHNSGQSTRL